MSRMKLIRKVSFLTKARLYRRIEGETSLWAIALRYRNVGFGVKKDSTGCVYLLLGLWVLRFGKGASA